MFVLERNQNKALFDEILIAFQSLSKFDKIVVRVDPRADTSIAWL